MKQTSKQTSKKIWFYNFARKFPRILKFIPIFYLIFGSIFLSAFLILIFSARLNSQTTDEGVHLSAGYTYLKMGDFRYDPEHPPLLKELAAAPLLFINNIHINLGSDWQSAGNFYYDSWREARIFGDNFLYSWGNNANQLIFWSRFPIIFLTLILGFAICFLGKKLYGQKAGLFAAFLTLFFPSILAHGNLINTDLGLTLFIFLSVYFWGKYLKAPNVLNLIFAGFFIGLAFASKYTAVILIPILIVLAIIKLIIDKDKKLWPKYLLGLISLIPIIFLIAWATYGFSIKPPTEIYNTLSTEIRKFSSYNIPSTYNYLFSTFRPYLVPEYYYKGLLLVTRHALGGQDSFLLGMTSKVGWWYYFPVVIFFKTPIPIFILLAVTIIYFKKIRSKDLPAGEAGLFDEYLLVIPPILFLIFAMYSKADLGIRHILPIFPFIFVFIAKSINLIDFRKLKLATIGFIILILWYLMSAATSFPNYLAYFNEFAGGPNGGHKILSDSNLDWGQNIYRIRNYVNKNPQTKFYIIYNWDGQVALNYYGLGNMNLPENHGQINGEVIISDSDLTNENYSWLKNYPSKQIAPGVFSFRVAF